MMPRNQVELPPSITLNDSLTLLECHYNVITPMYGGGAKPQEADENHLIRGSSIRGHLRFWWRATRSGQFNGDRSAMRAKEREIWGAPAGNNGQPSQVKLWVEMNEQTDIGKNTRLETAPAYAVFPLRPTRENPTVYKLRENLKFKLFLEFKSEYQTDVEAALWAWETFGGIGARTRRGFGALALVNTPETPERRPPTNSQNINQWLETAFKKFIATGKIPDQVSHLHNQITALAEQYVITNANSPKDSAFDVWENELIKRLSNFRQLRPERGNNDFGRSIWSEPDAIRQLTGDSMKAWFAPEGPDSNGHWARRGEKKHYDYKKPFLKIHAVEHMVQNKFPRAIFGLPIITQFRNNYGESVTVSATQPIIATAKQNNPQLDPANTTLRGLNHDRLASPLILRSYRCGNGKFIGIALRLQTHGEITPLTELSLWQGRYAPKSETRKNLKYKLTQTEAKIIQDLRDTNRQIQTDPHLAKHNDVISAFMAFLRSVQQ
jgi:CRISPR-associated protein Cmr1